MARSDQSLGLLKRRAPLTTEAVAAGLGVSRQAALQSLRGLARSGLVASHSERRGVGRPRLLWTVTDAGNATFADAHAQLAVELIGAAREAFGDAGVDKLIEIREAHSERAYGGAMEGSRTLAQRVARLASIRTDEGYMAEWSGEVDGSFLLVENHCPICAAATICQGFCRSELEIFRNTLGPGVSVERTDHILAGARRCAYRITPV